MRSVPKVQRGAYVAAIRVGMEGTSRGKDSDNEETEVRGNCFSFFPEMLRSRPPRRGLIPKGQLNDRMIRSMPENGRYCCVTAALHQERRPLPRCGADTLRVMTLREEAARA